MGGSTEKGRVLVVNTAFAGDVVLTTPLFTLLRGSGWTVDALVAPRAAGLLDGHPHLDRVIVYDKRAEPGLGRLLNLGRGLRGRYDAVIIPHRSIRSALVARLTRAAVRIGYRPPKKPFPPPFTNRKLRPKFTFFRFLHTHRVEYVLGRRESLRICDLVKPFGIAVESEPAGTLAVADRDFGEIEARLAGLARPLAVIFPGSAWGAKRYPPQNFGEVGRRLAEAARAGIVVCGGADEADVCAEVFGQIPKSLRLNDLTPGGFKALVRAADLVVTNDSAPLHVAAALGTPVVGIYGPTTPVFGFRPPEGSPHRSVFHGRLDCQPCRLHPPRACPLKHHRCMLELEPDRIVAACLSLLEEVGP
jgi:heptosyltransferase-2